jgi:integrase
MADNRLTAVQVVRLTKVGRYGDGGGLYLRVVEYETKAGRARSKNWLFRFERGGKERLMGLGSIDTLTLKEARERARECRKALLDGLDPIELRKERRQQAAVEAARGKTFRACAEAYIKAHAPSWTNPRHAKQWPATLAAYVYPTIGALPVAAIDTALVVKCLEPIWTEKPETAGRVRGRIESVLDWAKAHGYRGGENPARWRGHLENLLPDRTKRGGINHHAALPFADLPAFMAELRGHDDIGARALEFTILTAARTGEAVGAKWSEFDFEAKLWTVPGERTKSGRAHIVPLSDRAVEIARGLPAIVGTDFLFPGTRDDKPMHNKAMLQKLGTIRPGVTVHGFRSTFRDWAGDRTNYARDIIEAALAHAIEDETEAAYRRSTAVDKRRRLMGEWARFCAQPAKGGKVIAIRGRSR